MKYAGLALREPHRWPRDDQHLFVGRNDPAEPVFMGLPK
jgi:hypothetical protein